MKRIVICMMLMLPVAAVALAGQKVPGGEPKVAGAATLTKFYKTNAFDKVSIAGGFQVEYVQGKSVTVHVCAPENTFEQLDIRTKGRTLSIGMKHFTQRLWKPQIRMSDVKVYISSPDITAVSLAGSGNFTSKGTIDTDDLKLSVAGSGDIRLQAVVCNSVNVSIAGSGDVDIKRIATAEGSFSVAGSGDINVHFEHSGDIQATVAGSGDMLFTGQVRSIRKSVAGSGDINTKKLRTP